MPTISPDTQAFMNSLLEALKQVSNLDPLSIQPIDADSTQNKNFIINTETSAYFLKVYAKGSIEERIFEARILEKLHNDGYTFSPQPITLQPLIIDTAPVMIFEAIEGTTLDATEPISDDTLTTIASQLARMHTSFAQFDAGEKTRFNALDFEFIEEFHLDTSDPTIAKGLHILKEVFSSVSKDELISTIIHDDLSPHNVMRSPDGALHFIDFDDAHRSYRISDIGTVIKEFIVQPSGIIDTRAIDLFINAYEATENTPQLTDQEKDLIIPMVLRRALFMYAYYSMVEKERRLYLQSHDEYRIVTAITLAN
jgi:Ser/Thr protein kinase RdoA (MazF antagonist)